MPEITSLPLSQLIGKPLVTTHVGMTVLEALDLAHQHDVHHFPVVESQQLVGFVCTCDLFATPMDAPLGDAMRAPVSLQQESTVGDVVKLINRLGIGSVVVCLEDLPVGIVTRGDLLELWPEFEELLPGARCECCGATRHLRTNSVERTLCVYCRERSQEHDWFELGAGG